MTFFSFAREREQEINSARVIPLEQENVSFMSLNDKLNLVLKLFSSVDMMKLPATSCEPNKWLLTSRNCQRVDTIKRARVSCNWRALFKSRMNEITFKWFITWILSRTNQISIWKWKPIDLWSWFLFVTKNHSSAVHIIEKEGFHCWLRSYNVLRKLRIFSPSTYEGSLQWFCIKFV